MSQGVVPNVGIMCHYTMTAFTPMKYEERCRKFFGVTNAVSKVYQSQLLIFYVIMYVHAHHDLMSSRPLEHFYQ